MLAAIVLNHRTSALTLEAVECLRRSERRPDLVLVVDNGSGDGSAEALLGPDVTVIALGENRGFSGGVNAGIRRALELGADAVVLVNSDARPLPGCLGALEAALGSAPAVGIVGPLLVDGGDPGRVESAGIFYLERLGLMRHLGAGRSPAAIPAGRARVQGVSGCVLMARREVFEKVGLFAEEYFFSFEDLDFCLRAAAEGFTTLNVREARAVHLGSATIGRASGQRLYFAARNHLLLAQRARPLGAPGAALRACSIAALNLAHALLTSPAPRREGLRAVARGVADHLRGSYGPARG